MGRKRLPDGRRRERFWAWVERVGGSPAEVVDDLAAAQYWTKTRGLRHQPGPRLAGEGAYALARHGPHVHLAYAVAERGGPAEVRDDLRVAPEASYVVAAFSRSVARASRGDAGARRFVPLEPDDLDLPGTELVLIATGERALAEVGPALDLDRLLVRVARSRGAFDVAVGERLAALSVGGRTLRLGFAGIGDDAREQLGIAARTAQDMAWEVPADA